MRRPPLEDLSAAELAIVCRSLGLTEHADYLEAALADLGHPTWLGRPTNLRSTDAMAAELSSTVDDIEQAMADARTAVRAKSEPTSRPTPRPGRTAWAADWSEFDRRLVEAEQDAGSTFATDPVAVARQFRPLLRAVDGQAPKGVEPDTLRRRIRERRRATA